MRLIGKVKDGLYGADDGIAVYVDDTHVSVAIGDGPPLCKGRLTEVKAKWWLECANSTSYRVWDLLKREGVI